MTDVSAILKERGARYGDFSEVAELSQALKRYMRKSSRWEHLSPTQRESLEMTANKLSRILNGDPDYIDSWQDIVGYMTLVVEDLERKEDALAAF